MELEAAICVIRARAFEGMENRAKAAFWYQEALTRDVKCSEALDALVEKRMLKQDQAKSLLSRLSFPEELSWLRLVYMSKLAQLDASEDAQTVECMTALRTTFGLGSSADVRCIHAQQLYHAGKYKACHQITKQLIAEDPFHAAVLPLHISCLVELELKADLFALAHQLVDAHPETPMAWYAVGCYYMLTSSWESARKYFTKATQLDRQFAPAWVGFGHSYAVTDDSDQAMAAYRTANRLFEGSYLPMVFIGMEHARTQHLDLAESLFKQAISICDSDALIWNEMGTLALRRGDYLSAIEHFERALSLVAEDTLEAWEGTIFNLGHAFRKQGRYEEAIGYYEKARALSPKNPSNEAALALAYAHASDLHAAVKHCHNALGLNPRDMLCQALLTRLFELLAKE